MSDLTREQAERIIDAFTAWLSCPASERYVRERKLLALLIQHGGEVLHSARRRLDLAERLREAEELIERAYDRCDDAYWQRDAGAYRAKYGSKTHG